MLSKLAVASALVVPSMATAATFTDTQNQTVSGQNFVFDFTPAVTPTGSGTLDFLVRGDFTLGSSLQESFSFDAEGIFSDSDIQATASNLVTSFGSNDNLFAVSYMLSLADLAALAADNTITVDVDFASGVGAGANLSANPFVTTTLNYASAQAAVPEPATWALMVLGFGLIGGAMRVRRRKADVRVSYA